MPEWLLKFIPLIHDYPGWVQGAVAGWIVLTAVLIAILVTVPRRPDAPTAGPSTNSSSATTAGSEQTPRGATAGNVMNGLWPDTGDRFIDATRHALNVLEARGSFSESELVEALRNLFNRPAFFHVREERAETLLYGLCATQDMLEHYMPRFKSDAAIRDAVGYATTRVIKLKQQLATLYGPTFDSDRHYSAYGSTRDQFVQRLPAQQKQQDLAFVDEANETLKQLDATIRPIGFK